MKKLFALLLLPSIAFAGKIGENYLGAKLGAANTGISISGVDVEWDGFAFKLNGNYNAYNQDAYGVDLNLDFISGSSLDGPLNTSGDITKFEALLRPHMTLSDIKIFANLGVSVADLELKIAPNTYSVDESSFLPGLGFELSFEKLTLTPTVDWVDYDSTAEGVFINLPVSYEYNDKVSITFEYEVASFDDFTISGTKCEGNPYEIFDVWYYPERDLEYDETGIASWYGEADAGKPTANGEIFDPSLISAAHKTLPLPSVVRVTNLENGRSIAVRVNDRGPFVAGRIIDMSEEGARVLGFHKNGVARVRVQILVEESLRLEREAKNGNFPMLADLTKPELPSAQAAEVPASTLVLNNGQTVGGNGVNSSVSAIDLINNSASPNLLTGEALPTSIWIQVGAFSSKNNARAVMSRVSDIAEGEISSFDNGINVLHRVRLGPVTSVEEADRILLSVIKKGYQGSKIILE